MKYDLIRAWLDNVAYSHSKSENTEKLYTRALNAFCTFIGKTPQQILDEYEVMNDREFRRRYAQYLKAFISNLSNNEYAVGSIRAKIGAVKSFFKYSDLPLGFVPTATNRITFHNRDITKKEIVRILQVSHPRDRAFFTLMAQTGLRPDTICKLKLKHIQPDFQKERVPCKVEIPEEIAKGKYRSYFTFMSEESLKYLKIYLATRRKINAESYLFTSHGTDRKLNPKSISTVFKRTLEKLKAKGLIDFEQKGKRKPRSVRLYNLRKFFRKFAHQAGFEIVQFWMGHVVHEGVDEHYRPKDVEFHRRLYEEKALPHLRLETPTPSETEETINELRTRLEKREGEIGELHGVIWDLKNAVLALEKRMEEKWEPTAEELEFIEETRKAWREERARKDKKKKPLS